MNFHTLDIVRDHGHVRDELEKGGLTSVVWTAAQFFDRIRFLAFFADDESRSDDKALLANVIRVLAEENQPLSLTPYYAESLRSLHHGLFDFSPPFLQSILSRLSRINQYLVDSKLLDPSQSLRLALSALKEMPAVPAFLSPFTILRLHNLVDLTPLELEIFLTLADLGLATEFHLPLDEKSRGLTLSVSHLAAQIEKRECSNQVEIIYQSLNGCGQLEEFTAHLFSEKLWENNSDHAIWTNLARTPIEEAEWVAKVVAGLRARETQIPKIAVATRTLDNQAHLIADALLVHGVPVQFNAKKTLADDAGAQAILKQYRNAALESEPTPRPATLIDHWRALPRLQDYLREPIDRAASHWGGAGEKISLREWMRVLELIWRQEKLPLITSLDASAVQILALPELLGRTFDFVVIADLVHGKLPKSSGQDPLLKDDDRLLINKTAGRSVLRLYQDDPVEPSITPAKEALESLWFMGACAAAQNGVIFSAALTDLSGREQAPSEFYLEAVRIIGKNAGPKLHPSAREFVLATQTDPAEFQPRFEVDPELFRRRFSKRLGLTPEFPLTPTRLEALASCRFKGFVEKLLFIDTEKDMGASGDARILGRLAHEVLEKFYRDGPLSRERLSQLVREQSEAYKKEVGIGHPKIFLAQTAWLETALQRLVSNLEKNPPVSEVVPRHFELAIGTGVDPKYPAVPILIDGEPIYFGGIIDRVDEGAGARIVVDYKTSTALNINAKVREKEVLRTHFQLPLYLRLLHHALGDAQKALGAYLVSIRDGTTTSVLGVDRMPELREQILDDSRTDGLAAGLQEVLGPLLKGKVTADVGERCDACRLKRVCRVDE